VTQRAAPVASGFQSTADVAFPNTGQPFYPASWTNEDIWRALLGLQPLPSELVDIVSQAAPGEKAYMKKVGASNVTYNMLPFGGWQWHNVKPADAAIRG
jgi:hypothetical protein